MTDLPIHDRAIMRLLFSIRENRFPISNDFDFVEKYSQSECTMFYLASFVHDMMRTLPIDVYEHAVDQIESRIQYLDSTPVSATEEQEVA